MDKKSIYALFHDVVTANKDSVAYRYKKKDNWVEVTWDEQNQTCKAISKSLIALGLEKDDKINILSNTNIKWIQLDLGAVNIGCVNVGIYASNLPRDCAYIINHCEAKIIFVEDKDQLEKIAEVRSQLPALKHVVTMESFVNKHDWVMSWDEFIKKGSKIGDDKFEERTRAVEPNDVASIVYTSGTTGVPKGAMISHQNLIFASWSASQSLLIKPGFENLLFLPLAHVFARIILYVCLRNNITISISEGIEKVAENLQEIKPHFFASIPRIYEKVYEKITIGVQDAGGVKEKLFNWALGVGSQVSKLKLEKKSIPAGLSIKYNLANKLVFTKIQAALGGRIVYTISGAAPLNKKIAEFFHACGILILEGLGMTENSSFTNVNRFDNCRFGTVGQTGPDIEQKIAQDGEVLFRGENVMLGYFKNEEATAETIDKDGWLYTGDIGEIDDDGFLKITDRKKDLIITAGGKNIAPQHVERAIRSSRYFSQVVAIGDQRKYLSALITLVPDEIKPWAIEQGIQFSSWEELLGHEKVIALVEAEIARGNEELASYETIKKFTILPADFTIEAGELTPTLKVKRKAIMEKYSAEISAMY
ncbi:MAG: long-chain fatty acid--CoA ligase [Calditrichaeota bacterium]|nr:MAG: long-chain fatty acid--CoA ligase [Calditrichota bacterium]